MTLEVFKDDQLSPGPTMDLEKQAEDLNVPRPQTKRRSNPKLVLPILGLIIFTASMEQTVIGTVLPVISAHLHASPLQYSWVTSSYLLGAVVILPLVGRTSDIFGRKIMLQGSLVLFFVTSVLCGASRTMPWLICSRAFQGVSAGGMISLVFMVVSEITPLEKRGLVQALVQVAYTIAGAIAPVIGGALADYVSWRWCFYINLPTCGLCIVALAFFLHPEHVRRGTLKEHAKTFDFLGLALITVGAGLITSGFSVAANVGFSDRAFIAMAVVGLASIGLAVVNSIFTTRQPIIPKSAFVSRAVCLWLVTSIFSSMCLISSLLLLPQLFQGVKGSSPIRSGVEIIPFSVSISGSGIIAGFLMSRYHIVRPLAWFGLSLASLGYGLFYKYLEYPLAYVTQEIVQVISAMGLGISLMVPLLAVQAALPPEEMGAVTGAFALSRAFGSTMGVAILQPVFSSDLATRLSRVQGYGTVFSLPDGVTGFTALHEIQDNTTRNEVLTAFAKSMRICWLLAMIFSLVALLCSIFTAPVDVRRTKAPSVPRSGSDPSESSGKDAL